MLLKYPGFTTNAGRLVEVWDNVIAVSVIRVDTLETDVNSQQRNRTSPSATLTAARVQI